MFFEISIWEKDLFLEVFFVRLRIQNDSKMWTFSVIRRIFLYFVFIRYTVRQYKSLPVHQNHPPTWIQYLPCLRYLHILYNWHVEKAL